MESLSPRGLGCSVKRQPCPAGKGCGGSDEGAIEPVRALPEKEKVAARDAQHPLDAPKCGPLLAQHCRGFVLSTEVAALVDGS